jgi:hypothetical protein
MPTPRRPGCFSGTTDYQISDLNIWRREFAGIANASYSLRGIEMTLTGSVERSNGQLVLTGNTSRPTVRLGPLEASNSAMELQHEVELATGGRRTGRLRAAAANLDGAGSTYHGDGHWDASEERERIFAGSSYLCGMIFNSPQS